jgi:hypothetical protein
VCPTISHNHLCFCTACKQRPQANLYRYQQQQGRANSPSKHPPSGYLSAVMSSWLHHASPAHGQEWVDAATSLPDSLLSAMND